jgi:hypothetical protein
LRVRLIWLARTPTALFAGEYFGFAALHRLIR